MKCNQSRPGFELVSPCPNIFYKYMLCIDLVLKSVNACVMVDFLF